MVCVQVVPSNDYLEIREGSDGIDLVAGSKPIDREAVCPTVFRPDSECIMMDYTILAIKGADVNSFQLRSLSRSLSDINQSACFRELCPACRTCSKCLTSYFSYFFALF